MDCVPRRAHRLPQSTLVRIYRPIQGFLTRKWNPLIKEVWAFRENRIAVRFAYEWHDDGGYWFRSYGNENWEFDEHGLHCHKSLSLGRPDVLPHYAMRVFLEVSVTQSTVTSR
jgi:nuclear transport factor 2 (NTF2) superfamily protein